MLPRILVTTLICASLLGAQDKKQAYDPLRLPQDVEPKTIDLVVRDEKRERDIPVLVHLDSRREKAAPVLLFSHGLGGSREGCGYLGRHWAARGYVAVFVQHPGSDASLWREAAPRERKEAMNEAASGKNFRLRLEDVPVVLDRLEDWNLERDHPLKGRLDLERVGMAGHSFGARTTQALAGQRFGRRRHHARFADRRIDAALVLSPSSPKGLEPSAAFGEVRIPWLLMTGTKDVAEIGDTDLESRLAVFPALPKGGKYELVLNEGEHHAFTDGRLRRGQTPRNPNHHRAILAIGTAFFDAWLREDRDARRWLDGEGPRSVLEEKDRWQTKLD